MVLYFVFHLSLLHVVGTPGGPSETPSLIILGEVNVANNRFLTTKTGEIWYLCATYIFHNQLLAFMLTTVKISFDHRSCSIHTNPSESDAAFAL